MLSMSLLKGKDFWKNREERILAVLIEALLLLTRKTPLLDHEDLISRELSLYIREVNARHIEEGKGVEPGPFFQANNQPDPDDLNFVSREVKKPDFQWGLFNASQTDPRKRDCYFVIECKRLGSPTKKSPNRSFNKAYVTEGLIRFITEEHGYAKGETSAVMIGYVQDMEFDDILKEVNDEITKISVISVPNLLSPIIGWKKNDINQLEHTFIRVINSNFALKHLWVDLRGNCVVTPSPVPNQNPQSKNTRKRNSADSRSVKKLKSKRSEIEEIQISRVEFTQASFEFDIDTIL